jgi:hypothetical protein
MQLTPPKVITFWIAVFLALLGGVAWVIPLIQPYSLILVTAAFIILMLGNLLKKL